MGLESHCYLAKGAKVYLTSNAGTEVGLCNGTAGVVKMIVYKEGTKPVPPALPEFVVVDFGESYRGESFFPGMPERAGWVPVYPLTARSDKNAAHSRTMIPLKLAYAWTVWKSQGQTYRGKVVFRIPSKEPEHGITYVAFSRVTKLENLGIEGDFSFRRFTSIVRKHKKVKPRVAEERRMWALAAKTERYMEEVLRQEDEDEE
jgi:ATP-dependent exoDNAse (exonuclease V) alpha subunit